MPFPRTTPTPCEASLGCAKGHWRDEIRISPAVEKLLDLFWSGAAILSESEKRHPITRKLFAGLQQIKTSREQAALGQAVALAVMSRG